MEQPFKITTVLAREEIRALVQTNAARSWISIGVNWGLIVAAMAAVVVVGHPLVVVLAAFVIGARQLGMAILMHEASHESLFESRTLNRWVGNWLVGYPVGVAVDFYRPVHLAHHAKTGTADDPDLALATGWPVSRASMARKILRDLTGVAGVRRFLGTIAVLVRAGSLHNRSPAPSVPFVAVQASPRLARRTLRGMAATQLLALALAWAVGHPSLYLLWIVSWLTTYSLCLRIRSIAEHALTGDADDPLRNTRTVTAGWLERLFIAPNHVCYHLEHHLLMTVPHYNLRRMHQLLKQRGALDDACIARGYAEVLRRVVTS